MTTKRPARERQALLEVGQTEISAAVSGVLVVFFLLTVAIVPVLEPMLSEPSGVIEAALEMLPRAARSARTDGLRAANRALQTGIDRFESALEENSFLRAAIQPPTQRALRRWLGVGNEQAYLGHDGWLFFRDDFDHVTGPGFLEPRVLAKSRLDGSRAADPVPAILRLRRDLSDRGIELIVMPTPVKPTVHPEFLAPGATGHGPIHNPSFPDLVEQLEAEGIRVFEPAEIFEAAKATGAEPLYLETDTHWTPNAVLLVARSLAETVEKMIAREVDEEPTEDYRRAGEGLLRRRFSVSATGDTARMLEAAHDLEFAGQAVASETTEVARVMTRRGRPWSPDRAADVLILGDSFTNIYSDSSLGWGTGAGLAEQLSFELGRPVDRIALNAGGAWASRQALARASQTQGADRLSGKRVVIYQFATRELSLGDWKIIEMPLSSE